MKKAIANAEYVIEGELIFIPRVRFHPLDPSQSPKYNSALKDKGVSCKTIFDCTVPLELKEKFKRSQFMVVDLSEFIK